MFFAFVVLFLFFSERRSFFAKFRTWHIKCFRTALSRFWISKRKSFHVSGRLFTLFSLFIYYFFALLRPRGIYILFMPGRLINSFRIKIIFKLNILIVPAFVLYNRSRVYIIISFRGKQIGRKVFFDETFIRHAVASTLIN